MRRIPWVERKFNFDFPVELYAELLERLGGTPARVAARLAGVSRTLLVRRTGRSWSIQEHAGHLADLDDGLFIPRLDEYELGVATLRAADMTNRATESANHNGLAREDLIGKIAAARQRVIGRLESLPEEVRSRTAHHPRLGRPMRLVDLMYFHAEHDDHHLASIAELLRGRAG